MLLEVFGDNSLVCEVWQIVLAFNVRLSQVCHTIGHYRHIGQSRVDKVLDARSLSCVYQVESLLFLLSSGRRVPEVGDNESAIGPFGAL